jgi:hypothetical protein
VIIQRLKRYACRSLAAVALLLSPALVVFAVPIGYGVLGDLIATAWLAPMALIMAAAIAFNAARRATPAAA